MEPISNEQSSPAKSTGPVTGASATDIVQDEKTVPFSEKMGSVDSVVVEQGNKKLNPNAKEWEPNANGASEDDSRFHRSTGLQADRSTGPVDRCAHYRSTGSVVLLCHRLTGGHEFDPVWPKKCCFDPCFRGEPKIASFGDLR
ncbi:hypothetical protein L484_021819 [Morus notabilis]|uniref:Uncharacterized protein n=1 Tax=Morus notabilis TaxID=981085 RepID=W9QQ71_9ROSA|nr:hypothetical protein L484_021819 [Morus notabilis]